MAAVVRQAFEDYPDETMSRIWAHQLACYREIRQSLGDNQYKSPHSGIKNRQIAGEEVLDYSVDPEAYNLALQYLDTL